MLEAIALSLALDSRLYKHGGLGLILFGYGQLTLQAWWIDADVDWLWTVDFASVVD